MSATSTISISDLVFVSPKATTSAAAAAPPVAAAPHSVVENAISARQPSLGTSLDLPAASSGVVGLSDCISKVDPRVEAMISELESRGFFVAEMKTVTLRTIAASESVSKSTSLVKA